MDFDNDITKIDLPNDTAYTTFQNIWTAIQEIQSRLRFHEVDLSGSPALPPVDRVDICLRQSDSKLVAVKSDGSIVDLENSAAVSDHGTKVKENGVLVSTNARPINIPLNSPLNFTEDAFNDHFTIDIAADGILDTHIGAHTSTKITIDNLGQLPSSLITETNTKTLTNKTLTAAVLDANIISTYLELTKLGADPSGNPATDRVWLYVDANEDLIFEKDTGSKTIIGGGLTSPVGIADGGTGQTSKTNAFDALSPLTTLGDIIYRNASDNIRLGIGSEGQVLTVVSGVPAWAAAAGGGGGGGIMDDFASGGIVWGWHYPHGIIGGGLLNNVASDIVEQGVSIVYSNTANKGYGRRITGIDGGAEGWTFYGKVSLPFRRELDCFVDFWLQLNTINCRVYAFFTDDSTPSSTSDSPLDSNTGFGIMATLAGNFRRVSNDGSGVQQLHGSDLFTKDTNLRHIRIESDTANSKWIITVDGTPTDYTFASIDTPAASTQMYFIFNIDESGGAVDQTMDIYKFKCGYKLP